MAEDLGTKIKKMGGVLIFALLGVVISFVALFFDESLMLALPAFLASLFMIYVMHEAPDSKLKNIIGSYATAIVVGTLLPAGLDAAGIVLPFNEDILGLALALIVVSVFVIFLEIQHAPAIASLVWWAFGDQNLLAFVGFGVLVLVVIGIQVGIAYYKKKQSGGLGGDLGDLGKGLDLGKGGDLGLGDLGKGGDLGNMKL